MPEFAFNARDSLGNSVEGSLAAPDMTAAGEQIRRMGYVPVEIRPSGLLVAGGALSATQGTVLTPTIAAVAAPEDRTLALAESPAPAPAGRILLGEDRTGESVPSGHLEPWQRGGPVPQPPTPTVRIPSTPEVTRAMAPLPGAGELAASGPRPLAAREGGPRIPYQAGNSLPKSLAQNVLETLVYPLFSGVVIKDLAAFYRQFATLLNAGLPLYQCMVGLESNTENRKLKEIVRAGQAQVLAGGQFSDVMASYPWIFSPMQTALTRAAEAGGTLDDTLRRLADYVEHELEIRRLISRETLYPKLVLAAAIFILGLPGLTGEMPAVAQLVVGSLKPGFEYTFGRYLWDTVGFSLLMAVPISGFYALVRLSFFNVSGVRETYDTVKMSVPGVGKLVRMFALARFGRTFASLYRGGFPMGTALEIAGDTCGNAVVRKAALQARPHADRGALASEALRSSGVFPPLAIDMFRTGETTGNLDEMMDRMAEFYESEARLKSHMVAMIFATGVFLLVALLVGRAIITQYMSYGNAAVNVGSE